MNNIDAIFDLGYTTTKSLLEVRGITEGNADLK
ncbi:hypothetical protein SAMN04489796_102279 [Winogradskyella thalassocola]|uniref:Uncharacterized protein n=1 Tax=Winogradskyella thalassocola TaxID=262004 RepID=A0A1G8BBS9_9FLAO|nr:hypothetical protein SAMN04489796_102279 [Winogradskyella thalassocola]